MVFPVDGDVSLKAGDQTYVLRINAAAIRHLERMSGKSLSKYLRESFADMDDVAFSDMFAILSASLCHLHSGSLPEESEVDTIVDSAGLQAVSFAIGDVLQQFVAQQSGGSPGATENPPKKTAGTGKRS